MSLGEDGLIVPVIHRAHELSVEGLAARIKDLARRARARELTPDEVRGGTFTITNPGQYGSIMATPIINQPQVAILDFEAVVKRPVVVTDADGNDSIAIRPMTILGLSWDHRALDGALSAQFLASVKRHLEAGPAGDARALGLPPRHGRVPEALALQERIRAARQRDEVPDVLLLLEHLARLHPRPAVGARRAADGRGVVPDAGDRDRRDRPRRQGHLPRSRTARRLSDRPRRRCGRLRAELEQALVAALAEEGVSRPRAGSRTAPTTPGVWVGDRKIASIGVHVARGVTTHGFAVNVENDLQPFDWVVPCGLDGVRMTSLIKETGRAGRADEVLPPARGVAGGRRRWAAAAAGEPGPARGRLAAC